MIFIFSRYDDPSTNHVVDWLKHLDEEVVRINTSIDVKNVFNTFGGFTLSRSNQTFSLDLVKSVWFRRPPVPVYKSIFKEKRASYETNRYFYSENSAVVDLLYFILQDKKWLNDNKTSCPRKIDQLVVAKNVGLNIPNTAVLATKKELVDFRIENGFLIMKPLQDPYPIPLRNGLYTQYTCEVTNELIDNLPDSFYPCMFQQKIDKNLEIRAFYLDGRCYSMAICSSFDKQTQVDYRRYNDVKPNRKVPYCLPSHIEKNIDALMKKLKLNCGSLDLILDNNGVYYYLEVNPVGQFGMVSFPCNYNLEKIIAEYLSDN